MDLIVYKHAEYEKTFLFFFFSESLAAVKLNGKWGYLKNSGEYLVEPIYEDLIVNLPEYEIDIEDTIMYDPCFDKGLVLVRLNCKYGFLKNDGTYLVEPIFDDANSFKPDKDTTWVKLNGKLMYINREGKYIEEPQ